MASNAAAVALSDLRAEVWGLQVRLSREPAFQRVTPSLMVARRLRHWEYPSEASVICDLTAELRDPASIRAVPGYCCFPILDASTLEPHELVSVVRRLTPEPGRQLLIHCANGHGRTGLVAAAWLIQQGYADSPAAAISLLQSARPRISLRECQTQTLDLVAELLRSDGKTPQSF